MEEFENVRVIPQIDIGGTSLGDGFFSGYIDHNRPA
jgi:hypothetical protein